MFVYCLNNPANKADPDGDDPFSICATIIICGGVVGALAGAYTASATGGIVLLNMAEGFLNGVISTACGLLIGGATGADVAFLTSYVIDIVFQWIGGGEFDADQIIKTGVFSAIGALIPGFPGQKEVWTAAIGTCVGWSEISVLIASLDIVISNIVQDNQTGGNKFSHYNPYVYRQGRESKEYASIY